MKTGVLKKWWVGGGLCVVLAACGPQTPGHEAEGLEGDALEESPRAEPAQGTQLEEPGATQWTQVGPLVNARALHTATLLYDARVLVVGGFNTVVEVFDPITSRFNAAAPTATTRRYHTATLLVDGRVLVVGGAGGSGQSRMAEVYDPVSRTWSLTGAMLTPRSYHAAVRLVNGTVVVSGGYDARTGSVALARCTTRARAPSARRSGCTARAATRCWCSRVTRTGRSSPTSTSSRW